jgi:hypothetical protein
VEQTYRRTTIQDDVSPTALVVYPLKPCTIIDFHVLHMCDKYIIYIVVIIVLYIQKVEFGCVFWDDGGETI